MEMDIAHLKIQEVCRKKETTSKSTKNKESQRKEHRAVMVTLTRRAMAMATSMVILPSTGELHTELSTPRRTPQRYKN